MQCIQKGNILIAEPTMVGDMLFSRSVVFLTDYSKDGSVGFILNKPSEFDLSAFFDDVPGTFKVYRGGPVQEDNLYYIHRRPEIIEGSFEIAEGIFWGGNFEQVIDQIKNGKLHFDDIKFFLGYSGWDPNQLEEELAMKAWLVSENIAPNQVFLAEKTSFWKDKIKTFGDEYLIWSNIPEDPRLN